jgi:polyhydroxyalkanoate synthesis regulator phasin
MAKKDKLGKLIKKGLLVGVGIASYAQEKAEKFAKELVKKGALNKTEGKKLVRTIYREADRSRKKITSLVEKELRALLKARQLVNKKPVRKKKKK